MVGSPLVREGEGSCIQDLVLASVVEATKHRYFYTLENPDPMIYIKVLIRTLFFVKWKSEEKKEEREVKQLWVSHIFGRTCHLIFIIFHAEIQIFLSLVKINK